MNVHMTAIRRKPNICVSIYWKIENELNRKDFHVIINFLSSDELHIYISLCKEKK